VKPVTGPVGSIRFLIVLFVIFGWMSIARLVRAQVMSFKEREFIEAARAIGASNARIVLRHMIPNTMGPLLVSLSLGIVGVIVGETTLAIFGYGPQPGGGRTSLGVLVGGSKQWVKAGYWWLVVFPIAALLLITLCISFIGDGLRDATDPKFTAEGK
jgi:peptide/nickel transport system permease protein